MVWVVLGIILALILAIILFAPLNIRLFTDKENKPKAVIKILFLSFSIGKDKKEEQNEKNRFGISGFKKLKATKENTDKVPFSKKVSNIINALKLILEELLEIFSRLSVKRLHIKVITASSDAAASALEYGAVCATVYPLVGWLSTSSNVKDGAEKVEINCDYNKEKPEFSFDIILSVKLRHLVGILFDIIKKEIFK